MEKRGDQAGALGPGVVPTHPCPSHVVPLSAGQPGLCGVGLVGLLGLGSGWARPIPSFAGMRGSRSEIRRLSERGGHRETKEGDKMGMSQVRWGRLGQAEEVRGMAQERVVRGGDISGSSHREEIMGDGGQSGSQKEAVRRGGGQKEQFRARWSKEEVRGRRWGKVHKERGVLSKCVPPGRGLQA